MLDLRENTCWGQLPGENGEGVEEAGQRRGRNYFRCGPPHSLIPQEILDDDILPKTLPYLMVKDLSLARWLVI